MRLGLNWRPVRDRADLEDALPVVDELGLGTVSPPRDVLDRPLEECAAYGELLREHGLTVGEIGYWENLFDPDAREERIERVRTLLRRADAMHADCVVSLVGSHAASPTEPHPENYTDDARDLARENCRRILDGLDLESVTYALEPWYTSFFHRPRPVSGFLDSVDDDRLGVHMDAMNMHTIETCHRSTAVIEEAFDLLADDVAAVHAKDLIMRPGEGRAFVCLEEAPPGEGAMDYDRYVRELGGLPDDVPVYTEHWSEDETFVESMRTLRAMAERNGVSVVTRDG